MFRTTNKSRKILEKQRKSNYKWLVRSETPILLEQDIREIEESLAHDAPADRLNLSDALGRIATWYAVNGQVLLLDGEERGWNEVHRAWLYRCLALRIQIAEFQKGRVLGQFRPVRTLELEAGLSAACLTYALAVGRDFETTFFGEALRVMVVDNDVVSDQYRNHHCLEPFAIQLLALSRKQSLDVPMDLRRELRVYSAIVDAWKRPSIFTKAIHDACEYHCQRLDDKAEVCAEFRRPPFDLVPAEILAVYKVRQDLGLDSPAVAHPLLDPPFNHLKGSPSEVEDALLDRIEATI